MAKAAGATLQTADGSYRIHEVVAVGGFASVYFGRNLKTNVPVAVKMLHPHHVTDERIVRHFINEAAIARSLQHPNVVGIIDQGQAEDGQPFIVMEWMTGWTIGALIAERGAFVPGEAAFVAEQTLRALAVAHAHRVYHRDIKPANVMLTADGVVKVMDFGISKDAALAAATGTASVMGTPAYMAPEQFRGEPPDGRTDLYAVGVTLYQMLAGRVPFESTSTHGLMYQHLEQPPRPLRELRADLPPALGQIVLISLEKARERRFQSAEAMASALAAHSARTIALPSRPPDSTMVGPAAGDGAAGAPLSPFPSDSPVQPQPGRMPSTAIPPAPPVQGWPAGPTPTPPSAPPAPAWGQPPAPTFVTTPAQDGLGPAYAGPVNQPGRAEPPAAPPVGLPPAAGRPSFFWPLVSVLVAVAVFGGLAGGYLLLKGTGLAEPAPTPTVAARATSATATLTAPGGTAADGSASPTTASVPANAPAAGAPATCSSGLTTASNQRQQHALADAATTLEGLRASGCDVAAPLYDVYVDLGRELADADRIDEAITRFDQALQVRNGDEARNARTIAAAYREGRGAVDRQSWDDAIQKLQQVRQFSPGYAGGNATKALVAALAGKGDDLRRQGKFDDALTQFNQASELQPNDAALAARIRDTQAARDSKQAADATPRQPTTAPAPPPTIAPPPAAPPAADATAELERVARMYYDTLDAALDSGRFDAPYSFLSVAARQQQTLNQFAGRFVNTRRIALRTAEGARIQGDRGILIAHTYTETSTAQGLVRSCSQVGWELVREPQGWRRDVVSGSGNEQGERC